jgi:hypothetical protein
MSRKVCFFVLVIGCLAFAGLFTGCSSVTFRAANPATAANLPKVSPAQVKVLNLEELNQPFTVLGEVVVQKKKAFDLNKPDLLTEAILNLQQQAGDKGAEALLNVVEFYSIDERPEYLQPAGRYEMRLEVRGIAIRLGQGNAMIQEDQNNDGNADFWRYSAGGKTLFEFADTSSSGSTDGIIDLEKVYLYDQTAPIDVNSLPRVGTTVEKDSSGLQTSIFVKTDMGNWARYFDTNRDGTLDVESSVYSRYAPGSAKFNGKEIQIEKVFGQ